LRKSDVRLFELQVGRRFDAFRIDRLELAERLEGDLEMIDDVPVRRRQPE
jgi:hypothetical protein